MLTFVGFDEINLAGDLAPGAVYPVTLDTLYMPVFELVTLATATVPEGLLLICMLYSTSGLTSALSVYAMTSCSSDCSRGC